MSARRIKFACLLLALFVVLAVPHVARAANDPIGDIFGSVALDSLINAATAFFQVINKILVWAIGILSGWLQGTLNLDPSGGGAVIYQAWRTLRDLCNMAFIVALIMMAFGTIFNSLDVQAVSFLKPYSVWGRGVVVNFLIAAILLNFSLAIGQTVMAASNKVSDIFIELLPKDLGPRIAQQVSLAQVSFGGLSNTSAAVVGGDLKTLPPSQYYETQSWPANQQALLTSCLKGELNDAVTAAEGKLKPGVNLTTPAGCYAAVKSIGPDAYSITGNTAGGLRQSKLSAIVENDIFTRWGIATKFTAGRVFATKTTAKIATLTGYIFGSVMLGSLLVSFLVIVLFALIRIPAIWILLALSPIAWTALAFPGTDTYQKWWKEFWAWNLFSPLYLFVLYLGMFLLQNTDHAIASLGAQQDLFLASAGVAFQYLIAAIVFTGGTAMALKASFLSGTFAGQWVNRITNLTGSGGTYGGFAPVGRFLGTTTGATAAYRGAVGGIQAQYDKRITRPANQRQENIEARVRARFGDSAAYENLQRKRIQEQSKKNEEAGLSIKDMKTRFTGAAVGTPEYFALGQALLKEGELDGAQMKALGENASSLGPVGQNAIRQQIAKKIAEQAKEKKFAGPDARDKALAAFSALTEAGLDGGKEREKFLRDLKKNQIAVYAQLADNAEVQGIMASGKLDVDANGRPLRMSEIIESNTSKLEADDIPALMKLANLPNSTLTLGDNFKYRRSALLNDKNNVSKIMDGADAAGKREIQGVLNDLKQEALNLESQKADLGVLAQERLEAERENRARAIGARGTPGAPGGAGGTGGTGGTGGAGGAAGASGTPGGVPPIVIPPTPSGGTPPSAAPSSPAARAVRPISPRQTPSAPPPAPTSGGGSGSIRPSSSSSSLPTGRRSGGGGTAPSGSGQKSLIVTIDGRPRGTITVAGNASDGDMRRAVLQDPVIAPYLQGKTIARSLNALGIFNITTGSGTTAAPVAIKAVPIYVNTQLVTEIGFRDEPSEDLVRQRATSDSAVVAALGGKKIKRSSYFGGAFNIET